MMKDYKFKLEKYQGRTTRHTCPHCEIPKIFARYVDERGHYIADNVGRCNKEDKCGYHLTPSEYFKNKGLDYTPMVSVTPKQLPQTDYVPEEMMVRTLTTDNHLLTYLKRFFGLLELAQTVDRYRIGDAKEGRVIYWQIDEQNLVRTGKMMMYDYTTGHRVKNVPNSFDWVHRHIKKQYQLNQCLYGLHLINDKPIAIVESEKSAIIASLEMPNYTWMATGGKQNYRLMEAVKGLDVTLFPDLGAFNQWSDHANKLGFKISNILEQVATDDERKEGLDIADFIIKKKSNDNSNI